jgi:ATP-dependent Lon protease
MEDNTNLDTLLNEHFAGRVVRKDLTKLVKEGANVPVYVLEYLLGMYCASDDEVIIQEGLETVKRILAENYVRPDEGEKVKSKIRELGTPALRSSSMKSFLWAGFGASSTWSIFTRNREKVHPSS